jgi:integrase
MSGRQLRIVPYNGNRAYKYYLDGYKVNGKRKRLFFKDESAANRKRTELAKQQRKEGQDGLNAFFEHCVKRRLVENNPIGAIDKVKLVDKSPEILTPEELFKLLAAAPFELLPVLAIQAFTGLRTEEAMRLDWSEVDQVRGYITVSAKKAKTARHRLIPMANNLVKYLNSYAGMSARVWPKGGQKSG